MAVDAEGFTAARADLLRLLLAGLVTVVLTIALLSWVLAGRALRTPGCRPLACQGDPAPRSAQLIADARALRW